MSRPERNLPWAVERGACHRNHLPQSLPGPVRGPVGYERQPEPVCIATDNATSSPCPASSGVLLVAHPKPSIPRPQTDTAARQFKCRSLRDCRGIRPPTASSDAAPCTQQGGYGVGYGCRDSKNRTAAATLDPQTAVSLTDHGTRQATPPTIPSCRKVAPWALIIGEEHFTYSGYHSKRWCQGPSANFLEVDGRDASRR